jgi:hypothetical protein
MLLFRGGLLPAIELRLEAGLVRLIDEIGGQVRRLNIKTRRGGR